LGGRDLLEEYEMGYSAMFQDEFVACHYDIVDVRRSVVIGRQFSSCSRDGWY
jgi:hypothetical protein